MSSTINVSITEEVARDLQRLRERYPDMSDEALFRFSLLELSHKVELERRQAWADSLPVLDLTEEQQDELDEAIRIANKEKGEAFSVDELKRHLVKRNKEELSKTLREADKDPGQIMTVDEIMDMALND